MISVELTASRADCANQRDTESGHVANRKALNETVCMVSHSIPRFYCLRAGAGSQRQERRIEPVSWRDEFLPEELYDRRAASGNPNQWRHETEFRKDV